MKVRRKHVERLVEDLLFQNKIELPPVSLDRIARSLRLEVVKQDADDKISGMLVKDLSGSGGLIGVNRRHHPNRQRFTVAHEIGHFLLHDFQGAHFDGDNTGLQINFRDDKSSMGEDLLEREANLFAAELLMPRKLLEADLKKHSHISLVDKSDLTIKRLAQKYGVSVRAITFRLAYLKFIEI